MFAGTAATPPRSATFSLDENGAPRGASVIVRGARDTSPAQVVPVASAQVTIGRGAAADVVVRDDALSRKQCTLTFDMDGVVVRDLGSSCGTYVNGEKIGARRLRAGDRILIGNTVIELAVDGS